MEKQNNITRSRGFNPSAAEERKRSLNYRNNIRPPQKYNSRIQEERKAPQTRVNLLYEGRRNHESSEEEQLRKKIEDKSKTIHELRNQLKQQQEIIENLRKENRELKNSLSQSRQRPRNNVTREDIYLALQMSEIDAERQAEEFEQMQLAMIMNEEQANPELRHLLVNPDEMTYEQLMQLQEEIGSVNVGMSEEQIRMIPTIRASREESCAICLVSIVRGEYCKALPACKHSFHPDCVDEWLRSKKSCPLCLKEVT